MLCSHPLGRTHFGQYQASLAVLGVTGDDSWKRRAESLRHSLVIVTAQSVISDRHLLYGRSRMLCKVTDWSGRTLANNRAHQLCYQATLAVLGWPRDGDWCLMHRMQPGGLTIRQVKLLRYKSKLFVYPMLKPTTSNNQSSWQWWSVITMKF